MRTAPACLLGLALTFVLVVGASAQSATRVKKNPNEIALEELHDPQIKARSAYDAIQRLRPNWIRSRGTTSLSSSGVPNSNQPGCGSSARPSTSCNALQGETTGRDVPGVMLNEVRVDFDMLRNMKAFDIVRVIFMSASDATTQYGTGYPNGLILVWTTVP